MGGSEGERVAVVRGKDGGRRWGGEERVGRGWRERGGGGEGRGWRERVGGRGWRERVGRGERAEVK